jgi:hypothetical protein
VDVKITSAFTQRIVSVPGIVNPKLLTFIVCEVPNLNATPKLALFMIAGVKTFPRRFDGQP